MCCCWSQGPEPSLGRWAHAGKGEAEKWHGKASQLSQTTAVTPKSEPCLYGAHQIPQNKKKQMDFRALQVQRNEKTAGYNGFQSN